MTNRSLWTSFLLVRNESWHRGNVVLLGDAAHTAHFSIGSGTKLAMEDAIALAQAFLRHPRDLERALVDYELERQPVVERFQQAAGDSAAYFSRVEHYAHMDPMPFAFNLLTRSGRVTHANLAQRDPQFVRVLDAWFHGGERGAVTPPPLFAPWRDLRNRIVRAAARAGAAGRDGAQRRRARARRARRRDARRAHLAGHADARRRRGRAREAGRTRCTRAARTRACCSPTPGAAARPARAPAAPTCRCSEGGWPLLAPSPIAYAPRMPAPRAMDADAMDERVRRLRRGGPPRRGRRVRRARARHGPRLPARVVPLAGVQPPRRRVRGRPRRPPALPAAGPRRGARGVAGGSAARGAAERHGRHATRAQAARRHRDRARAGGARLRAGPRRGRADRARGPAGRLPPRLPHPARRPRACGGARADARRRLPDDARRGEHDPRRRPRRPVPARRPRHRARAPGPRRARAGRGGGARL